MMKTHRFRIRLLATMLLSALLLTACNGATKLPAEQTDQQSTPPNESSADPLQTNPTTEEEDVIDMTEYPTVTFADIDFSDLGDYQEAAGADSGVNGKIYVIALSDIYHATGDLALDYDYTKFAVSLQGILNREDSLLYIEDGDASMNWFRFLRATTDGVLYGKRTVELNSVDKLIETFAEEIKSLGIALWDPSAPYTSNIATNICGVEGYLPVMYSEDSSSLCQTLIKLLGEDIVKVDLRGKFTGGRGTKIWDTSLDSTGSAKCDAYLWAIEKYIKTGKSSASHIAYMTDFYPLSEQGGGSIPIAWAFNPNLMERIPMVWDVFYATATDNDYFIGGDSGAGYINPMLLRNKNRKHSTMPSGIDAWTKWCTEWYKKADLSITGMILDGLNGYATTPILKAYQTFSSDGIGVWNWPNNDMGVKLVNGTETAVTGMENGWGFTKYNTAEEAGAGIVSTISTGRKLRFYPIKTNIIDPALACDAVEIARQLLEEEGKGRKLEVVDPYTFFAMLSRELSK